MIYGHDTLVASLRQYFAPVSAFVGPRGVGKWTVAEYLRVENSIHHQDVIRFHRLDAEAVETLKQFSLTAPVASPFKLAIVELYRGTDGAQEALAGLLESPKYLKIIFISEPANLSRSISSRAVMYKFKPLRVDEVSSVLVAREGFSRDRAAQYASVSGGQVSKAMELAGSEPTIELVRRAVVALRSKDADALSALAAEWTDDATSWLVEWCHEAISGQWRGFSEEDRIDSPALPIRILQALAESVRPRLVVRSQLMKVLKGT